jgi:putative ABC transport system permease protein
MRNLWRRIFLRGELERHLDAELRDHFERQVADFVRSGMPEAEARRRVRLEFGGIDQIKEECRDVRGFAWVDELGQDIRYALRGLRTNRRFAIPVIGILALAVGGASAVFSVVDRSLFRPLPFPGGDRLVSVGIVAPVISTQDWLFAGIYEAWSRSKVFESMGAWKGVSDCDRSDGAPERLRCAAVDANFLVTLGVRPAAGRVFSEDEDQPGGEPVVLISHALFASRFGGDAQTAIGQRMTIDGVSSRILGVLPQDFETPTLAPVDVVLPLRLHRGAQRQRLVHAIARVRQGSSVAASRAEMEPVFADFVRSVPADFKKAVPLRLRIDSLREHQTREYKLALLMLFGAVLCFVLMACANIANLMLARAEARRHEFAVRASLGASKYRLARQALTESGVLAILGGALGCLLAFGLLRVLSSLAPMGLLHVTSAEGFGVRGVLFAVGLSQFGALLFGLAPVADRLRGDHQSAGRIAGRIHDWLRPSLVAFQFAVSLVLLTSTGLFLTSLWKLQQAQLGFSPERVVTASFLLPEQRYGTEVRQIGFFRELESSLLSAPGVVAAAITDSLPPGGDPRSFPFVALQHGGGNAEAEGMHGLVKWRYVTPGYFATLGIRLRAGRLFTEEDRAAANQPVVVSESLAMRLFGDPAAAVGKTVKLWNNPADIIGVASDVRNAGVQSIPDPEMYMVRMNVPNAVSANQRPPFGWRIAVAAVRTSADAAVAGKMVEEAVHKLDPTIAVVGGTLDQQLHVYFERPRFQTLLLSLFAILGLMLAAAGLYGLTAFLVAARTREMGVRIALGATPARIQWQILLQTMRWTVAGLAAGLLASVAVARGLRKILYEASTFDVRVVCIAILLLVSVSVAGAWVPSLRASRTDPMEALRRE